MDREEEEQLSHSICFSFNKKSQKGGELSHPICLYLNNDKGKSGRVVSTNMFIFSE